MGSFKGDIHNGLLRWQPLQYEDQDREQRYEVLSPAQLKMQLLKGSNKQ